MRVRVWGARGSLPTPGAEMVRYGGNTSCVQVTLSDGTHVLLDAGTGIRNLPADLGENGAHIHVLLPSAPRPHPGPAVLRAAVRARRARDDLGARDARAVAAGEHRSLPVCSADAGRGPRASVPAGLPRLPGDRVVTGPGAHPRR